MAYPPDPDAQWEPVNGDRELAIEDFTESPPPLREQYVPVAPIAPAPVYEEDQPWEGIGPALSDLAPTQEEVERMHSVGVLSGPEDFADLIASEMKEVRKKEYDIGTRAYRGAEKLPFVGGFISAGSMLGVYDAAERYNKRIYHEGDAKLLAAYMAEGERVGDLNMLEKGAEILLDIPGYAAEIYATGGAMTAGRAVVRKTLTEVAEKLVKRGVMKSIGKKVTGKAARKAAAFQVRGAARAVRAAGGAAGLAVGGASMAAVSPWLVAEQTTEHAVRNALAGDDEAFANALWQGPLSASITLASEFAGGMTAKALSQMPGVRDLKKLIAHNWLQRNRSATLNSFLQMRDRIGWHGILGEIEEERIDEILHGLTGLSDDYGVIQRVFSDDPDVVKAAWSQLGSEALAFGTFGAAFALPNAAKYGRGMDTPRQRVEKFLNRQSRGNYDKMEPGVRAQLPQPGETIVVKGEEVAFDPSKGTHREAIRENAEELLQKVDLEVAEMTDAQKTEIAGVAQIVVTEGEKQGDQTFKGLLYRLKLLLAEDNPGEAILREGIPLELLQTLQVQVAGVPALEGGQRRTPEQLLLEYPQAASELSQASEVNSATFKRLTGAGLSEGEGSEVILEYQKSLQAIVIGKATLGLETAAEQLEAIGQAEMEGQPTERFGRVGMGGVAGMPTMQPPVAQAAAPDVAAPAPAVAEAPSPGEFGLGRAATHGSPFRFTLYRGAGSEASAEDAGPADARLGSGGLYYTDNRRAAEIYAEHRPGDAVVSEEVVELRTPFSAEGIVDQPGTTGNAERVALLNSPEYNQLFSLIEESLGLELGQGREFYLRTAESHSGGVFAALRDALRGEDKGFWPGAEAARQLVEAAGFDGIVAEMRDVPEMPNHVEVIVFSREGGAAARGGAPGAFGVQDADTGPATAELPTGEAMELYGFALPELVELATNLLGGRAPEMSERLREAAAIFKGADGQFTSAAILMNPLYAKNITEATQILGHELGHLIDYLPDSALGEATTKRGNILGRIRGLQKYTAEYLSGTIGGPSPLSASEKARLRQEARRLLTNPDIEQEIIDDSGGAFKPEDIVNIFRASDDADINKVLLTWFKKLSNDRKSSVVKAALSGILPADLPTLTGAVQANLDELTLDAAQSEILAKYHELLEEEIRKRELLSQDSLREELIELSYWWTPYDEATATPAYTKYRHENRELFAQALSVLLVAPKELKDRAPEFWRGFMAYISRNPEFLQEYQELQDLLAGDSAKLMEHRSNRVLAGYQSGEEALLSSAAARQAARMSGWDTLVQFATQGILDRFAPGKKLAKRARKLGATVDESRAFEALLDEMFTIDAPVHALVMKTQRTILEPLTAVGVTMENFGEYVMMRRIIMERSEVFNPLGHTPESAAEAINHLEQQLRTEITHPTNGRRMTQFEYLEEMSLVWHRKIVFPIVEEAVEAGVYSREKVEGPGGLRENIDNYSTFLVVKYITENEKISPMLEKQVGTFGVVANPFVATMLKLVTLHRFNQVNRTKGKLIGWMETYFKEDYEEIIKRDDKGNLVEPQKSDLPDPVNQDIMRVLVNGDMKYYAVDQYIVKMFNQHDIGMLQSVTGLMSSAVYQTFHPLFVTYNPSFIAGNWIRDIQRTHRNLGAQSKRLEYETAQAYLQGIRDREGREPNQVEVAQSEVAGRRMRIGLLDILKERHKLMGWGRVAQFLSGGVLKPGRARRFARGKPEEGDVELVEQMMEEHAYAIPLTEIESQTGQMVPGFVNPNLSPRERAKKEIARLKELDDPTMLEKFKSQALPAWGHLLHAFEILGAERLKTYAEAQELAGKMTGYNLLEQRGVETRERAFLTRKDSGTPDFMQRGLVSSLTNSLLMYSKVRWNALQRDAQLLKGDYPKTRSAWIMHQMVWTIAPTTFVKLAGYGALGFLGPVGDELEEWYKLFSKYFVDNYDVIPLGTTQVDGKRHAVGLTIPRDETRSFVAQMWGNAMDAVVEATTDVETPAGSPPKALQDIYDSLKSNSIPNMNPYLDIATAWSQYGSGENPTDRFYKGDIIPRSNWEAGGWESNRKMLAWTIKKTGIINTVVHPFTGPILGDAFDDTDEQFKTTTVLRSAPILQRFLRVSQRGAQDRMWAAMGDERSDAAAFRLQLPKTVREANGRQYLMSHTQHLLDEDGKQELMVLNKWRSMTYMPAREKMLEAQEAGDEQAVEQLREQLSTVTKEVMDNPVANVPDLYLGAIAWQLTSPSYEEPLKSDELKILQANGRGIKEIEQLIKQEALRRSNMEAERTQKRLGRTYRPRQVPRITKALAERLNRMRRVFRGEEPRRRRIGRAGVRR
jgi:hypothetical protein